LVADRIEKAGAIVGLADGIGVARLERLSSATRWLAALVTMNT